tara:strand:- start:9189 stop:10949 length:1761 start_codon:yes stop_codon:yes gene_type:complete
MPDIHKLDPLLISKIAAGEVIERPASVVKELIENSIDAGSTEIRVNITAGGSQLLIVSDNGTGMSANNMRMAFEHHATSKIYTVDDLFGICTLGFRGEALPSVGSVAHVTMLSRLQGTDFGNQLVNSFGVLSDVQPSGCQPGTQISVSNIFDNLPPRKKFQKSTRSENMKIKELIVRYICAYPGIKFRLTSDDKNVLDSSGNGNLEDVLSVCFGPELSGQFIRVDFERDNHKLYGFISPGHLHRSNRQGMIFFVNGRLVNNALLTRALTEAYHGLIPDKRFPMGLLNITMPMDVIDVNAHPSKTEVRFLRESQIYSYIQRAVREHVSQFAGVAPIRDSQKDKSIYGSEVNFGRDTQFNMQYEINLKRDDQFDMQNNTSIEDIEIHEQYDSPGLFRTTLRNMHVVGQVRSTYIVGESGSSVYLIDQHAAHERIVFDKLSSEAAQQQQAPQVLLEPIRFELSGDQSEYILNNKDQLESLGIVADFFGENSFLIRAIPKSIATSSSQNFVEDLLLQISAHSMGLPNYALMATVACHSSIRAGQRLPLSEMESLLAQLADTPNPHTCPHGRPTVLEMTQYFLDRSFGRIK